MRLNGYSRILKILVIALFSIGLFFTLNNSEQFGYQSLAFETECPSSMDPNSSECLSFLQQQQQLIADEKNRLSNSITAEQLEQLSLYEQINYLNDRIQENELTISEIEIEIEKKNVEVNILNADIIDLEKSVDTIKQEINVLESSVHERTQISYKLSQISPLEVFMDSGDLENLFRKIKYLLEIKNQDHKYLADMTVTHDSLKAEEDLLKDKKEEVESMREDIETEYSELAEVKENLESQRGQQQELATESENRENQYQNMISELQTQQDMVEREVTAMIIAMFNSGQLGVGTPVSKGDIVGFQGHTGCSLGSHLHYEIVKNSVNQNPFTGYLNGGSYYGYVTSATLHTPLDGAILTQTFHSGHLAIDLISATAGDQTGARYYKQKGEVRCPAYINIDAYLPAWLPLRGEGAPIRASDDGFVYKSQIDYYGGKYVLIDHGNGIQTLYLHLL